MRVWHPEPNHKGNSEPGLQLEDKTEGIISHHEVLARLEAYDTERGTYFFLIVCDGPLIGCHRGEGHWTQRILFDE